MRIVVSCLLVLMLASCRSIGASRPDIAEDVHRDPRTIVVDFVGGFIRRDNLAHGGVQVAARLRKDFSNGVCVRMYENRRGEDAHKDILQLLDIDHDGRLSEYERQKARIIIYGHSWGGSETVALARALQSDHVPVLLTIQVDSVAKIFEDDSRIPSNVAEAVNYYELDGMLHGRSEIRAEDPTRTRIIGNVRFDYATHRIQCEGLPWYSRVFTRPHLEIECDPAVLGRIDSLIRSKLPRYPNVWKVVD